MRADWTHDARAYIARATDELPADATLKERRAALRAVAWQFHGNTSWGKKVWSKECRRYLERHGLPQRTPADASPQSKLYKLEQAGEITFPFRRTSFGGD